MHHDSQPFANRILTQTRFNNTLMPVRKAHVPLKIWGGMQGWCHPFRRVMTRCPWTSFTHLAIFVRKAPISRVRHFWKLVAETYRQQYNNNNNSSVWLSTEGSGVAWLHVRLDSRPKYYHYLKFAKET